MMVLSLGAATYSDVISKPVPCDADTGRYFVSITTKTGGEGSRSRIHLVDARSRAAKVVHEAEHGVRLLDHDPASGRSLRGRCSIVNSGDTAWLLVSTALVMVMLPGLALFYGGLVRRKNVLSTIMHSFFGLALVSVIWVLVGFSLAFGPDVKGLGLIGGLEARERSLAAIHDFDLVAKAANHRLEQPALYGIVVGDQIRLSGGEHRQHAVGNVVSRAL